MEIGAIETSEVDSVGADLSPFSFSWPEDQDFQLEIDNHPPSLPLDIDGNRLITDLTEEESKALTALCEPQNVQKEPEDSAISNLTIVELGSTKVPQSKKRNRGNATSRLHSKKLKPTNYHKTKDREANGSTCGEKSAILDIPIKTSSLLDSSTHASKKTDDQSIQLSSPNSRQSVGQATNPEILEFRDILSPEIRLVTALSNLPTEAPIATTPQKGLEREKPQKRRNTGWLPPDWTVQEVERKTGKTQGRVDVYFLSPGGKKYRSKVEVIRALQAEEG